MKNGMICWGMIGCGDVTEVKNGPGLYSAENSCLIGITNRTKEKAEDWVQRHKHGKVFDSVADLLADPEIDIVYIATTPDCHKEYAIACAKAGKHCYVEKPIALSYREAEEIRDAFKESGTRIFVAHYRRGMSRYKELRRLLNDGVIGIVRGMQVLRTQTQKPQEQLVEEEKPWRVRRDISGGGYFFETDIHQLDLIDYLVGPVKEYKFEIANVTGHYTCEDIVSLSMMTEQHVMVSGMWCYAAYESLDRIVIFGDKGSVEFQYGKDNEPMHIRTTDGKAWDICPFVHPNIGTENIQDIVDELLGRGICYSTLESAMRSLKITDDVVSQWYEK
jgi:predicted dehydrogenase